MNAETKTVGKFFFDTADVVAIKKIWTQLEPYFDGKSVVGVTTNPNAFDKIGITTMAQAAATTNALCVLISSIRGDDKGVVYVQPPCSKMSADEVVNFANIACKWTDNQTQVALKIPPFKPILEVAKTINRIMDVNVTGVADCATALFCTTYFPAIKYVSIIPGRMEEAGLDAKSQVRYITQKSKSCDGTELIAGSMRTTEGLKWVIEAGAVPTIGTRVWDILDPVEFASWYKRINNQPPSQEYIPFAPPVTTEMTGLSLAFFEQMDKCGAPLYEDYKNFQGGKL